MIVEPTAQQLAWQEAEMTAFVHFGINTFTNREWGDGTEDPTVFNPTQLDARQWAQVAWDAGFRYMILTAKHHDGFCLWPSRHTEHSVKHSPWRGGKGDVVREFTDTCREIGMKPGLYLSPWDRHEPRYGDSSVYNAHFRAQLIELLSEYGEIAEVWFDGACGEGPNGRKQEYDWQSYYEVVRRLQPNALIAICGPDIRWVGNENGVARETEWSVQDAQPSRHSTTGKVWYPAECDVSIRPGWFWHASEDSRVKSLEHLLDIYYKSVGRNSVLLLNLPPNVQGLIPDPDEQRLREFRAVLDQTFATDLAQRHPATAASSVPDHPPIHAVDGRSDTYWMSATEATQGWLEVEPSQPCTFDVVMSQEFIAEGQRVERYRVQVWDDDRWNTLVEGTTIGHKKLDRVPLTTSSRVRLEIQQAQYPPQIRRFGLFQHPSDY